MTADDIMKMGAGRELDALVAEHVMGLDLNHLPVVYEEGYTEDGKDGWSGFVCPRCKRSSGSDLDGPCCKNYSGHIGSAFEVVEHLRKTRGVDFLVSAEAGPPEWFAMFGEVSALGDTPEIAICRAALIASLMS